MPSIEQIAQNYNEWQIRGEFDLSSAGAVTAAGTRGDGLSVTKTGTGTYKVTVKGAQGLRASQVLYAGCDVVPARTGGTLGTALFARITSVAHAAAPNGDDVEILITTSATKGSAAADNGTAASTVTFDVCVRSGNIGAYP